MVANKEQVVLMWGVPDNQKNYEPVIAQGLAGVNVKQIVCATGGVGFGFVRSYILTEEGNVFQWGPDSVWASVSHKNRQITSGSLIEKPVKQIASGPNHFAAVTNDGELYTWGYGYFGTLGHGDQENNDSPKKVEALDGIKIAQVACSAYSTVALSRDGTIYTFGRNLFGCNGNGTTEGNQLLPTPIESIPVIVSISAFICHVAAVCEQGRVYTWGEGQYGQLGHGDQQQCSTPKMVDALQKKEIAHVSCGMFHTAAVTSDGKVYTFGHGDHGKLGHNNKDHQQIPNHVESLKYAEVSQVSCSYKHTCFLTNSGELYICGSGKHGHGSEEDVLVPRKVQSLSKYNIEHVYSVSAWTIVIACQKATAPDDKPILVSLQNMVNNEQSADVVFQTDDGQVFAHKNFLVERSEFFQTMFESGMQESTSRVIQLSGIKKNTLLVVLEYLYTGDVEVPLTMVVNVYKAADMYGLERLKQICKDSLCQSLQTDNAAQLLLDTTQANTEGLHKICFQFVVENIKAVSKTAAMAQVAENAALMLKIVQEVADCHL